MNTVIMNDIIGARSGLKNVLDKIHEYAHLDQPITLLAENGAGKEVIAKAIHKASKRSSAKFIRVNCASVPKNLQWGYLFGDKNAQSRENMGWFGKAHRGTLLLDQIGSLTKDSQYTLLEIVSNGTFTNKSDKPVSIDVKLVVSVSDNIEEMIRKDLFLSELWERLSVFTIEIPPLRKRLDDIADLADYFAKRSAERLGFYPRSLSEFDIKVLKSYSWPGNVRELASVMERAVILGEGRSLKIKEALGGGFEDISELKPLDKVIKNHIEKVLKHCKGKVEGKDGAAHFLQINPNTLRGKMKKLNIDPNEFREENK